MGLFINFLQALGVISVVAVVYYTILYLNQCWTYRKFTGPTAYPILGNCYTKDALMFLKFMSSLHAKFGSIFTFFAFTKVYLVVCDPVVIRRVLSDPKTFYKGTDYSVKFGYIFGEGLVTSNGEKHRKDRATFGKFFIRGNLGKYSIRMNEIADKVIAEYFPYDPNGPGKAYDVEKVMARLALRTFMNFAFGNDLSHDPEFEKKFCQRISDGSHAMGMLIMLNLPLWPFLPHMRTIDKCRGISDQILRNLIKERQEKIASGEIDPATHEDCLQAMLRENMTHQQMFEHFITLISAGHDTTAFFISYTIYMLAQHQDIQKKLYDYLMEKVGHKDVITADDFAEMKYLHCIMMETLRMYAIIPGINRTVDEEVHIKERNITIPAGSTVFIPMVIINRDPNIWENPTEFRPQRFEEKGVDFTSAREGYFPFGYGVRTCIGNAFSQIEAGIVLTKLLKLYVIKPDPKFKMAIRSGISLTTYNGVGVILEPRRDVVGK